MKSPKKKKKYGIRPKAEMYDENPFEYGRDSIKKINMLKVFFLLSNPNKKNKND